MQGVFGQLEAQSHVGEMLADHRFCQEIVVAGRFDRILLMFATFKRTNTCRIRVRLSRDSEGRDLLLERQLSPAEIIDNAWVELKLDTEIDATQPQSFFVIVDSPEARRGDAFTIRAGETSDVSKPVVNGNRRGALTLACALTSLPAGYVTKRAMFSNRDRIRKQISSRFLVGSGAEIGAGAFPSLLPDSADCRYFDLRTRAELARYFGTDQIPLPEIEPVDSIASAFKTGADFLIAHNVLEHCPDPLGVLMQWQRAVKPGGHVVLSVPQAGYGPDGNRLPVTIEHVLLDYALDRNADTFESREHCYSAMIGFRKGKYQNMSRAELAEDVHQMARSSGFDIHWHIFTPEVFTETLRAAAALQGRDIEIHSIGHAQHEDAGLRTEGEIVVCYRLGPVVEGSREIPCCLGDARKLLGEAVARLGVG